MAKKHEQNGVYELPVGKRITVTSEVRSLKVPTGSTGKKVDVDPKYLHVGDDLKGAYKFTRSATIPCLPSTVNSENVMQVIAEFLDNLRAYDAANEIMALVTVKRKGPDGSVTEEVKEVRGPRTIKLCAEYDKNGNIVKELTPEEYLAQCIMGEHTLGLQKRFYKANMPKALDAAYAGELGTRTDKDHEGEAFEKPPVKARRTKAQGEEEVEDIQL